MSINGYLQTDALTAQQEADYIQQYLPLVNKILRQLSYHANTVVDSHDLQQIALVGLLTALRRYGIPDAEFPGYAKYRIRGAILDELRQADWRPRTLRQKTHQLSHQIRQITQKLGREPDFADLQQALALDAETYHDYLQSEYLASVESLDAVMEGEGDAQFGTHRDNPERFYARQQQLSQAIAVLDPREQLILTLYYHHEMNFKEIALVLEISEARVCQLNKRLNDKLVAHIKQSESVC
ncbi:FliA/WhiG family RNA polymerase sigma factor [Rosenbergiella metrosideri]|uniref:FliA/WhiG family RNA polymerase sigma factor n=1 Tax=Rosenbergiella metrosideri TaxID=2921185 RepID=UPI001F4F15CB|nr:FliA/WhiG family RNA polymerase sigma factor [Rosenbergiella metrosideri]